MVSEVSEPRIIRRPDPDRMCQCGHAEKEHTRVGGWCAVTETKSGRKLECLCIKFRWMRTPRPAESG